MREKTADKEQKILEQRKRFEESYLVIKNAVFKEIRVIVSLFQVLGILGLEKFHRTAVFTMANVKQIWIDLKYRDVKRIKF